jgi:hypothetical protein
VTTDWWVHCAECAETGPRIMRYAAGTHVALVPQITGVLIDTELRDRAEHEWLVFLAAHEYHSLTLKWGP